MRFSTKCGLVFGLVLCLALASIVVLPIVGIANIVRNTDTSELPSKQIVARFDTTPEAVASRRKTIENLQRAGILGRVGSDTWTEALVRDGFYALSFDEKKIVAVQVWIFLCDGSPRWRSVTLRDERTNKKIGSITQAYGLKLR